MPHVKADFFIAGLQFVKFPPAVIEVQDDWFVVQLEWCAEDDGSWLMGKLEWYGQAVEVLVQRMEGRGERGGRIYNMYCGIPSSGEGKLNYFVLPKSGVSTYNVIDSEHKYLITFYAVTALNLL